MTIGTVFSVSYYDKILQEEKELEGATELTEAAKAVLDRVEAFWTANSFLDKGEERLGKIKELRRTLSYGAGRAADEYRSRMETVAMSILEKPAIDGDRTHFFEAMEAATYFSAHPEQLFPASDEFTMERLNSAVSLMQGEWRVARVLREYEAMGGGGAELPVSVKHLQLYPEDSGVVIRLMGPLEEESDDPLFLIDDSTGYTAVARSAEELVRHLSQEVGYSPQLQAVLDLNQAEANRVFSFGDDEPKAGEAHVPTAVRAMMDGIWKSGEHAALVEESKAELMGLDLLEQSATLDQQYQTLAEIYTLARLIYSEIPAADEYTRLTDGEHAEARGHYYIVTSLLQRPTNPTTVAATIMHDLERFFPGTKVGYASKEPLEELGGKNADSVIRKKVTHPESSAQLASFLLKGSGLTAEELERVVTMIRYHDAGPDGVVLKKAKPPLALLPPLEGAIRSDLAVLASADATAFFYVTMTHFIAREWTKIEKASGTKRDDLIANLKNRIISNCFGRIEAARKAKCVELAEKQLEALPSSDPAYDFTKAIVAEMAAML